MIKERLSCLGIDPSFGNLGWAYTSICGFEASGSKAFKGVSPGKRLHSVYCYFDEIASNYQPDFAVIEGYAFGQPGRREVAGELGGVIRLALHIEFSIQGYYIIAPSSLKKMVTGSGKASKEDMIAAVKERWGIDCGKNHDQADAIALSRAGIAIWQGEEWAAGESYTWIGN